MTDQEQKEWEDAGISDLLPEGERDFRKEFERIKKAYYPEEDEWCSFPDLLLDEIDRLRAEVVRLTVGANKAVIWSEDKAMDLYAELLNLRARVKELEGETG